MAGTLTWLTPDRRERGKTGSFPGDCAGHGNIAAGSALSNRARAPARRPTPDPFPSLPFAEEHHDQKSRADGSAGDGVVARPRRLQLVRRFELAAILVEQQPGLRLELFEQPALVLDGAAAQLVDVELE